MTLAIGRVAGRERPSARRVEESAWELERLWGKRVHHRSMCYRPGGDGDDGSPDIACALLLLCSSQHASSGHECGEHGSVCFPESRPCLLSSPLGRLRCCVFCITNHYLRALQLFDSTTPCCHLATQPERGLVQPSSAWSLLSVIAIDLETTLSLLMVDSPCACDFAMPSGLWSRVPAPCVRIVSTWIAVRAQNSTRCPGSLDHTSFTKLRHPKPWRLNVFALCSRQTLSPS